MTDLKPLVRDVPDFPRPDILFRDIALVLPGMPLGAWIKSRPKRGSWV